MHRPTSFALVALLAASAPLAAQMPSSSLPRANTSRLFLGLGLNGTRLSVDESEFSEDESDSGGGLSGQIGWGFTPKFAIFLEAGAARVSTDDDEDFDLAHVDLGARYHFVSPSRALVPYLEAALTHRAAMADDIAFDDGNGGIEEVDIELSGNGFSIGGGLQYFVAPNWALNAGLKWTTGQFDKLKVDDVSIEDLDIDATTTRLTVGVVWYPMANRPR